MPTNPRRAGPPIERIADALVALYAQNFGGKSSGRFRISRKFLRELSGRRRLPSALLDGLGEALFERGYVFIDAESYFVVLEQKVFDSYRRVTAAAIERVLGEDEGRIPDEDRAVAGPYPVPERPV